ncbi:hypothetical protein E4T48_03861 [Aureobasidium sp. EXF-10727]|nr:hypothetical protein E4T48_03861 [Aureobasidium sp. EXF-10727]
MDPFTDPSPKSPTLIEGYTQDTPREITIYCHDRTFKNVDIVDSTTNTPLFTVTSAGATSFSWRRTLHTPTGEKLFDLRHKGYAMKNDWSVEDITGTRIASLKHVEARNRSVLDAVVHGKGPADDVGNTIEIRPRDRGALSTGVRWQGRELGFIVNTEANDVYMLEKRGLDRSVWKAQVNAGVDVCLMVVAVLCLAEMEHVWRQ